MKKTFNYSKCPSGMLIPCLFTQINLQCFQNVHLKHICMLLSHACYWSMDALTVQCSWCAKTILVWQFWCSLHNWKARLMQQTISQWCHNDVNIRKKTQTSKQKFTKQMLPDTKQTILVSTNVKLYSCIYFSQGSGKQIWWEVIVLIPASCAVYIWI